MFNLILLSVLKKNFNITENQNGTYSLSNLTLWQMRALQCALIHYYGTLLDLKERRQREGLCLSSVGESFLTFTEEAIDQLSMSGF